MLRISVDKIVMMKKTPRVQWCSICVGKRRLRQKRLIVSTRFGLWWAEQQRSRNPRYLGEWRSTWHLHQKKLVTGVCFRLIWRETLSWRVPPVVF